MQVWVFVDIQGDTTLPSGATTPRLLEPDSRTNGNKKPRTGGSLRSPRSSSPRKVTIVDDSDLEPDELVPKYVEAKTKLFEIQRPQQNSTKGKPKVLKPGMTQNGRAGDAQVSQLLARINRIESDVLFDRGSAEALWRSKKIVLERDFSASKKRKEDDEVVGNVTADQDDHAPQDLDDDDVTQEAARIAAEVLAENNDDDDDGGLADLFASLPTDEVDASTGKTNTVINGADGSKIYIRDFGKPTGMNPTKVLEDACRSR